jgi:hypothetical protein
MKHLSWQTHYLSPADENIPDEGKYSLQNPTSRQQSKL